MTSRAERRAMWIAGVIVGRVLSKMPDLQVWVEQRACERLAPSPPRGGPRALPGALERSWSTTPAQLAVYVHVPFCKSDCSYCLFNRRADVRLLERYLRALDQELQMHLEEPYLEGAELSSLYVGGGTPTLLSDRQLFDLVTGVRGAFSVVSEQFQATLEGTPETLDNERLAALSEAGLHRLSVGVQSFDDRLLQSMGRGHSAHQAEEAVARARSSGFEEVSVDLIYGLEGQSPRDVADDINRAAEAGATHLSFFPLVTREREPIRRARARLEHQNRLYRRAKKGLVEHGFKQYSVEDATRSGVECQYQADAWKVPKKQLLGLGLSSLSGVHGAFFSNTPELARYLELVEAGEHPIVGARRLEPQEELRRAVATGLRFLSLELDAFLAAYGPGASSTLVPVVEALRGAGHATSADGIVTLTEQGEQLVARNWTHILLRTVESFAR